MLKDLFRRKALDQLVADSEQSGPRLKKALGPIDVTALGIGAIIGAGIFATIGTATAGDMTRPGAGPGLILSFIATGIACGFAALCYAEFAAMIPISGSAYTYAYATLGELIAWRNGLLHNLSRARSWRSCTFTRSTNSKAIKLSNSGLPLRNMRLRTGCLCGISLRRINK